MGTLNSFPGWVGLDLRLALMGIILILVSGCASTPKPGPVTLPAASPINLKVIREAMTLKGIRYHYGAETPEKGFDCSGFVQYVYGKHGIDLPRTAFDMASTLPVLDDPLREPGDLVFFNTNGRPYSHVGIYLGKNLFIHASSREGEVKVSEMDTPYWSNHYQGTRRPHRHGRHNHLNTSKGRWFY